jgi:hypothetical protein
VGKAMCSAGGGYTVTKAGDCNDAAGAINPGAAETCNGKDDNCNGTIDDGLSMATWYPDSDGDGWGGSAGKSACGAFAPYTASKTGDCNDAAAGIYPGAAEISCNGKDEDCNGSDSCGGVCAHDTCTAGGALAKGCSACVTSICNADPYCCNNGWDSICVNEVASVCGSAKCPGSCGHSLCSTGAKVIAGCDSLGCASKICAADPYCCNNSWDSICVGEISSVCGKNCN